MKKIILAFLVMFMSISGVQAACSADENINLNKEAMNVKASFEPKEGIYKGNVVPPDGTEENDEDFQLKYVYHEIYISNITENLYIEITNNVDKTKTTLRYEDSKDGVASFKWNNVDEITTFTINIFSSNKTNCANTKLTTLTLTTPLYNDNSESSICESIPEFYLCHSYLSVPNVDYYTFVDLANKYYSGKIDKNGTDIPDELKKEGFKEFIKENKIAVGVVSVLIIGAGVAVTVIIVKKQKRREI